MKIVAAHLYHQYQPFEAGDYVCRGHRESGFDSAVVSLVAEDGTIGWGEAAPLGAFYADGFPQGIRAAIEFLLPSLIGHDARNPGNLADHIDHLMMAQPAAKSAIDMAAWDLAARLAGVPLFDLLGGQHDGPTCLYRSISQDRPDAMAARAVELVAAGYRRLQVKVGEDPAEDAERLRQVRAATPDDVPLYADANGAWAPDQAEAFLAMTADLDFHLEQPCMGYLDNRRVARQSGRRMVLDEGIQTLDDLLLAAEDEILSGVTIKLARVGDIGPTVTIRDKAVSLGLAVTIEDTGGSTIDTAATAHMMASVPLDARAHTVDFMNWVTVQNATGMPPTRDGCLHVPTGPGLGIDVTEDSLVPIRAFGT